MGPRVVEISGAPHRSGMAAAPAIIELSGVEKTYRGKTTITNLIVEAVVLAAVGWAFGVLLGWLIYQGLLALIRHDVGVILPVEFPPVIPLITLAGLVVLTLIVIRGPLHRATRIRPGMALRYQ